MPLKRNLISFFSLIILFLCPFWPVFSQSGQSAFQAVFSFSRGIGDKQLLWLTEENGGVLDGPFQGPMAFTVDRNGNLWAGDTLNARIIAFDKNGKPGKIIDLIAAGRKAKLASDPVLLDFVPTGGPRLLIADAANNAILSIELAGDKVDAFLAEGANSWLQINRIHSDNQGRIYIEDIASMKTFVLNRDGKSFCEPLDGEVGLAVSPDGNMVMVVNDSKYIDRRQIVLARGPGEPFEKIAAIKASSPIIWAAAIGFSREKLITVVYDTASERHFAVFDADGKIQKHRVIEKYDPGYDPTTPEWVGSDKKIYSVFIASHTLKIGCLE